MRLWSLHPHLLDRAALVAGWREGLLAQKVLAGRTVGYRNHPQLDRFRATADPHAAIAAWLAGLHDEATSRGYRFDRTKLEALPCPPGSLTVTRGQLSAELGHLRAKVAVRQPTWLDVLDRAPAHPLFRVVDGEIEPWERMSLRPAPTAGRA
ncbi:MULTISPECIES: pyrimidine dimer DNA glycosylase/endonuclease V [unclassified Luteococcus]|uniref:pyrimidine dimer DNA glycosylase/endonuclease V n=1 Tax=unclassified Luteococcus TaxID=2639923 RepID=UPI00313BEED0